MAALGPVVVVAERPSADLVEALGKAGAFPIIETGLADAAAAIEQIQPAALILTDAGPWPKQAAGASLRKTIETGGGPFMPVLARVGQDRQLPTRHALPIGSDEPAAQVVARLRSALRVRALHATVLRRSAATECAWALPSGLLDHATVLCMGRGRSYPALTTAIGERVSLVGALNVETAARNLNTRDIDGIVIADGFSPEVVQALLTVLAEDARFRDPPVGVRQRRLRRNATAQSHSPAAARLHKLSFLRCRAAGVRGHLKRMLVGGQRRRARSETGLCQARRSGVTLSVRYIRRRTAAVRCPSHASPSKASTAAPASMPRDCSAGSSAPSTSPAASRTVRSSRHLRKLTCVARMSWRAGSPACSSIRCWPASRRSSRPSR